MSSARSHLIRLGAVAAASATNGLATTVLAFSPAQWNANDNLLSPAKSSDQTADTAILKGRSGVQDVRQVLRSGATPAAAGPGPGLKGAGRTDPTGSG